jgi:hypothetical protein
LRHPHFGQQQLLQQIFNIYSSNHLLYYILFFLWGDTGRVCRATCKSLAAALRRQALFRTTPD